MIDYRRPPPPRAFGTTFALIAAVACVGCVAVSLSLAVPAVLAGIACGLCTILD